MKVDRLYFWGTVVISLIIAGTFLVFYTGSLTVNYTFYGLCIFCAIRMFPYINNQKTYTIKLWKYKKETAQ